MAIRDDTSAAIEAMLAWSRDALSGLIGLGSLLTYLEAGGPPALLAPRLLREIDRTQAALVQLPALLDRLRQAAEHGHTEGPT